MSECEKKGRIDKTCKRLHVADSIGLDQKFTKFLSSICMNITRKMLLPLTSDYPKTILVTS